MSLDFTFDEVRRVTRSCAPIRIGHHTPPYFKCFLEIRLRAHDPALAARVKALDLGQTDELRRMVRLLQLAQDRRQGA